jgi:cyclopropane fatty-acyl-phospholipid synthase-like methyltransferase
MQKPHSPSCDRNREPILAVLQMAFSDAARVLEIGSGTGQHAVYFAASLPRLIWQATDQAMNLDGIGAWINEAQLPNTPAPVCLDVNGQWPNEQYDAVFSANTLHIMSWQEVERFFQKLPSVLTDSATVVIYGPFNYGGQFTSASNADFDAWLKARGAHQGIRNFEAVNALAAGAGLTLQQDIPMPANNRCLIWRQSGANVGMSESADKD